jgi:uncharacterized protein YbjT (DUF2867 family)
MNVIIGATGNVGSKVADGLIAAGKKVRVIGREEQKLQRFSDKGAESVAGSVEDAAFLTRVFEDAEVVFTMIPADIRAENFARSQDVIGEAISSALASANVPYVVNLSSVGAELDKGTGPITGLYRQEQRLNQLKDCYVLHLRPTYFMENFLMSIPLIKTMDINGSAIRADLPVSIIATRDIAEVAVNALLKLNFSERQIRTLLGPRDYTFAEVTRILGQAIGKPDLHYVEFSYEDMEKGLIAAGLSTDVAKTYVELEKALNDGLISGINRDAESTTPTTLEQFASAFAAVYERAS